MNIFPSKLRPIASLSAMSLIALLCASCTAPILRSKFTDYNAAYARALNEQMLLNLARLENGHPAYYLVIGTINEKVTLGSEVSAGTGASLTDNQTVAMTRQPSAGVLNTVNQVVTKLSSTIFTPTLSSKASRTVAPEFQFIPLNNEAVAKQVLQPISTDVFSTLYLQGYPIDQLMRVLIERIETTLPDNEEVVLVNSPTRGTPESYALFLRTCAILRELQRKGELLFDTNAGLADTNTRAGRNFHATTNNINNSATPTFFLIPSRADDLLLQLKRDKSYDTATLTNVIELLSAGLSIKTEIGNRGQARTRLVLRSFDRAMEAVASEQAPFEALMKNEKFNAQIPEAEKRPVLKLIWPEKQSNLSPPLQKLEYSQKTYQITDIVTPPLDPTARWNRDVFRLMVALGSQVTVDISKFQRQVLQLQ